MQLGFSCCRQLPTWLGCSTCATRFSTTHESCSLFACLQCMKVSPGSFLFLARPAAAAPQAMTRIVASSPALASTPFFSAFANLGTVDVMAVRLWLDRRWVNRALGQSEAFVLSHWSMLLLVVGR